MGFWYFYVSIMTAAGGFVHYRDVTVRLEFEDRGVNGEIKIPALGVGCRAPVFTIII